MRRTTALALVALAAFAPPGRSEGGQRELLPAGPEREKRGKRRRNSFNPGLAWFFGASAGSQRPCPPFVRLVPEFRDRPRKEADSGQPDPPGKDGPGSKLALCG